MGKIEAVIFDMDGLMIDSERITFEEYREELKKIGLVFDETVNNRCLGKNKKGIYQVFYETYGEDFLMDKIWQDVHVNIDRRIFNEKPIKDGLLDMLKYLKEHTIKTIVATSSNRERVNKILYELDLEKYFDASVCGNEVVQGKPNPEIFLEACKRVEVLPSNALVLEDSESGIMAGYQGGIKVVAIPDMKYPEQQYVEKTFAVVKSLKEALEIIKEEI